ncbi:methylase involved in ubiquinone/menaquinone biosynthesis [Desulfocapsa sulfexigens DSM 10523]|uniref:Methylase involved in ubiquinone/menaquinone biosynthesis n=1 Tax=Desulfocapsa sulfexigens (strain DSM 10523 / SB164P1) TaxID=1167006 RepID=M1PH96_DESSD|nr:class I SAM-dependent methyltransferase [Desulfocapsa sulfexigens]AGF78975.1 methylase involved in ubiquinone/menaquinone biosynthesis [Desulfocapsa sulfexigens DSM 10523]
MSINLSELSDFNTKNWDEYYKNNVGVEYPHEQLIIYVNYLKHEIGSSGEPKALETGFGSIADMRFLHRMNYEVYGLEVSQTAVEKGLLGCEKYKIKLNLQHWTPPVLPFENDFFDLFCSSNSIHFNLDQDLILSEIKRVLKIGGHLYTTYLAPGHKFIDKSKYIGDDLIQFTDDHYVLKMRKMVMRYYDQSSKLEKLYSKYFKEVRVTRLEYNILDAPNAYWIVTATN